MSDVAERLRREDRERQARMTPAKRVAEALALRQEAITAYAVAHGVSRLEARQRFERVTQAGRRPSRVMREITELALTDFGRRVGEDTWVLTRRGKPVAAVVPIRPDVDLESFGLSHNLRFIELLNRSWESYRKDGGTSLEEMRRRHAPARRRARRRKAR